MGRARHRFACLPAQTPEGRKAEAVTTMQFILGVIFFVIVVGLIDAGLPWPAPNRGSR
jgi:hypothetical protein